MNWTTAWLGLRYEARGRGPEAFDCLGLYLTLLRHRLGREVADPNCTIEEAARHQVAETYRGQVVRVREGQVCEGDALMFRVRSQLLHIGYAVSARDMLHIEEDSTGSVLEEWRRPHWRQRLEGIYRFV